MSGSRDEARPAGTVSPAARGPLRALLRLLGIVPTLDLHGLGVREALRATEDFLRAAAAAGEREVRIVYGKGRGSPGGVGVLRQAVPAWLEQNGGAIVTRFTRELDADGNDGAMRVELRPPDGAARAEADG